MNCLRSVSAGLVSIRYLCGLLRTLLSGRPCTRSMLSGAVAGPFTAEAWLMPSAICERPGSAGPLPAPGSEVSIALALPATFTAARSAVLKAVPRATAWVALARLMSRS
ncbi:hypothetical protein D3C81_1755530 [compost metagenome]